MSKADMSPHMYALASVLQSLNWTHVAVIASSLEVRNLILFIIVDHIIVQDVFLSINWLMEGFYSKSELAIDTTNRRLKVRVA